MTRSHYMSDGFKIIFYLLITLSCVSGALPYNDWTERTDPLPPTPPAAVAHDASNHILYLLGGINTHNDRQLVSYDYISNEFNDHGSTSLARDVTVGNQNYAQIGSILYIADTSTSYINTFNFTDMVLTANVILFKGGAHDSCLVGIRDEYLAVLSPDASVAVLDVNTNVWLDSVPSLQEGRYGSSCVYINDKVFIVGGRTALGDAISSIEYFDVSVSSMTDIASQSWQYSNNSLPGAVSDSRSIVVNDDILVIGGKDGDTVLDTVYVINSLSVPPSVSLGGYLAKGVYSSAAIYVNNIVYSFGGMLQGDSAWNGWQSTGTSVGTTMVFFTTGTEKDSSCKYGWSVLIYVTIWYILFFN